MIGLNHTTAPVEVREALAANEADAAAVLAEVCKGGGEAVLLSTCNRVELYTAGAATEAGGFDALCRRRGVEPAGFAPHLYDHAGRAAARHLFRVAASLDSMVPGERQIVGQVRRAYERSRRGGFAGRKLHAAFQRALSAGRRVMAETDLPAGQYGVAGVAAAYADEALGGLAGRRLLCVGGGKMVRLVLEHLHARGPSRRPGSLVVLGRDSAKADGFAKTFGGHGAPLSGLADEVAAADLVVCGTGSREPVVTADAVARAMEGRADRPLFVVDMAVPRDVEPSAGEVAGVHCYDLDDLQRAAEQAAAGRRDARSAAESIVEEAVARHLAAEHHTGELGSTVDRLYRRGHELAAAEVARANNKLPSTLSADDRAAVERLAADLSRRLVNKLLHGPVSALRNVGGGDDPARHPAYRHAVEKLFDLDA